MKIKNKNQPIRQAQAVRGSEESSGLRLSEAAQTRGTLEEVDPEQSRRSKKRLQKRSKKPSRRAEIKSIKKELIKSQLNSEKLQRGEEINPFDKLRINAEQGRSIKNMATKDILEKAKKELADLTGFKSPSAIGFKKDGNDLVATIEVIEKESIPDGMDVLGTYEVRVEKDGKIIGYERIDLRKRVDTALSKES